jgi:hypothetical protein
MTSTTRQEIISKAPPGTTGLLARCCGELYGVAAFWSDAASPVWELTGTGEWVETCWQVAYFRHRMGDALRHVMREARVPPRRGRWFST